MITKQTWVKEEAHNLIKNNNMSLTHLMMLARETNFDLQDPNGPMKHLEAFVSARVEEAVTKTENRYKGLVGILKTHLTDIHKSDHALGSKLRDHLIANQLIDLDTEVLVAPPTKSKGKEKMEIMPKTICGCITKDKKKPCQRAGVETYGGRCGHHKNTEGPRVMSVETIVVAAEPKSEMMAPTEPGPSEAPVPMTTHKSTVKMYPAEVVEDPDEVARRQTDFSEEERKMVEEMTAKMGMTNMDGEIIHEELEEWDPDASDDEEGIESDEVDYE